MSATLAHASEFQRTRGMLGWLALAALANGLMAASDLLSSPLADPIRGGPRWLSTDANRGRAVADALQTAWEVLTKCAGQVLAVIIVLLLLRNMIKHGGRARAVAGVLCLLLVLIIPASVFGVAFPLLGYAPNTPELREFMYGWTTFLRTHSWVQVPFYVQEAVVMLCAPAVAIWLLGAGSARVGFVKLPLRHAPLRWVRWLAWSPIALYALVTMPWAPFWLVLGGLFDEQSYDIAQAITNAAFAACGIGFALLLRQITVDLQRHTSPDASVDALVQPHASTVPYAWMLIAMPAVAVFMWSVDAVNAYDISGFGGTRPTLDDERRALATMVLCFAWTVPWARSPEKPLWKWMLYGALATLAVTLVTLAFAA